MSTNEMSKRSIDRLLRAIAQGDSSAFEKLYMQTKNGIYAFLYSYLRNQADTEDCLHDVFLKIHRYAEKYRENTNGRAWILQIAKNIALDLIRKRKTSIHEELYENIADLERALLITGAIPVETLQELCEPLSRLPLEIAEQILSLLENIGLDTTNERDILNTPNTQEDYLKKMLSIYKKQSNDRMETADKAPNESPSDNSAPNSSSHGGEQKKHAR